MKSILNFEEAFKKSLLENMNVAGGADSAFGAGTGSEPGSRGNQFPSQNDLAYAPGDSRWPFGRKKKKTKVKMQKRSFAGL
jgi:hypothetical protein